MSVTRLTWEVVELCSKVFRAALHLLVVVTATLLSGPPLPGLWVERERSVELEHEDRAEVSTRILRERARVPLAPRAPDLSFAAWSGEPGQLEDRGAGATAGGYLWARDTRRAIRRAGPKRLRSNDDAPA